MHIKVYKYIYIGYKAEYYFNEKWKRPSSSSPFLFEHLLIASTRTPQAHRYALLQFLMILMTLMISPIGIHRTILTISMGNGPDFYRYISHHHSPHAHAADDYINPECHLALRFHHRRPTLPSTSGDAAV